MYPRARECVCVCESRSLRTGTGQAMFIADRGESRK